MAGIYLLIQILKKLNLFYLTDLITLVVLMSKWIGLVTVTDLVVPVCGTKKDLSSPSNLGSPSN